VFVSSGNDIGREILTGGGITSMSISASGVFVDTATDENVRDAAFKGEVNDIN
jgi:predicted secreted protein